MKAPGNSSSHVPDRHPEMVDGGDKTRKVWPARLCLAPPSPSAVSLPFPTRSDLFSQSNEMSSLPAFLPASTRSGGRDSCKLSRTALSSSSWVARSNT